MEKITFTTDDGGSAELYVLEQTRISGVNYLLATEDEEGDGDAYILKDLSADSDTESLYEIVSDDEELDAVAKVFESMLDDIDIIQEDE